jgi:exosortase A-associated hydrolase 2
MTNSPREHYFIHHDDERLYAVHFKGIEDKGAVLMLQPFGDEAIKARRVLFDLAMTLSHRGVDVLLVDYCGTGNSSGDFETVSLDTLKRDVGIAIEAFQQRTSKQNFILLGLRLGATLASLVAEESSRVSQLILLDPVVAPLEFIRDSLRANLATQMMIFGKVLYKRDVLEQRILEGESVDVFGFPMTKMFYESCSALDLREHIRNFRGDVRIVPVSSMSKARVGKDLSALREAYEKAGATCDISPVKERPFWTELKEYYASAKQLADVTVTAVS